MKDVKVGDLIRPAQAVEPWFAEVIEVEKAKDPLTGLPAIYLVVEYEGNEYSLSGDPDWEVEERS